MNLRPATLRGQLALYVFVLVAGVTLAALVTIDVLLSRGLSRELVRSVEAQLRYVEGVMRHHDRGGDGFIREEMAELEERTGLLVDLRDGDRALFASAALAGRPLPDKPGALKLNGHSYQTAISERGPLRIAVAMPAASTDGLRRTIDLAVLVLIGGGLLLAGIAAHAVAARVVEPIAAVASAAEQVQFDSLSRRLDVPTSAYEEVGRLASAFNQMLERLDDAVGRLRRFTADAAHELRTPLAAMKAHVQNALANPQVTDTALDVRPPLLREIDRLSALVEHLLVLAEVDASPVDARTIDYSDLVVECVESARPHAERRCVELTLDAPDAVQISGDPVLIRQMVDNLLDNAIKYTPPNGHVRTTLRWVQGSVLTVADSGIGISDNALPHIFERFYRHDASRTRETGGAGLGLAIVSAVVRAHGGRVTATSEVGRGSTFEVELPSLAHADGPADPGNDAR